MQELSTKASLLTGLLGGFRSGTEALLGLFKTSTFEIPSWNSQELVLQQYL
jgi:hypothetical protein